MTLGKPIATVVLGALLAQIAVAGPAAASPFDRRLRKGKSGADVRALQVRVAGWYPEPRRYFALDGRFGGATATAVNAFKRHYGMRPNGVAGPPVFRKLDYLQDGDRSTRHFAYSEFTQNRSSSCSAQANAYAGTLSGGAVSTRRTRINVRRLMWRLEALRAKGGSNPIGVNSGFRSRPYNSCIGGASLSQHLYGTAADTRMVQVSNRKQRALARRSEFHGIACYSSQSHNHLDLRMDNKKLPMGRFWYWPERDRSGRELADDNRPCWGETSRTSTASTLAIVRAVAQAVPGAGSLVPSAEEVAAFERAGEPEDLGPAD